MPDKVASGSSVNHETRFEGAKRKYKDISDIIDGQAKSVRLNAKIRRGLAIVLKLITVAAGFIVGSGVIKENTGWLQILGFSVAGAGMFDQILANSSKLVVYTESAYAYEAALENANTIHSQEVMGPIAVLKDQGKDKEAYDMESNLLMNLHKSLSDTSQQIKKLIATEDIKSLRVLSINLQQETSLVQKADIAAQPLEV